MWFFDKKKEGITAFIEKTAKANPKRIVYAEPEDDRILKAAEIVSNKKTAQIMLLGNEETINKRAKELKINLKKVTILDFEKSEKAAEYAKALYELRKEKGMTLPEAEKLMLNSRYFGTMMVRTGDADGMVSGAAHSTADTLRPALQIIKTTEGTKYASSFFIMAKEEQVFFFADCAFIQDPNVEQLTAIAIQTSESAKRLGYEPKVAMLSFSTKGSGEGPILDKVRKATEEIKKQRPDLEIDGEMQLDAAIVPSVAKLKCPNSPIQGNANVLIFPDLNSGNIGYKLVERFGHTHAIGPVVQGLKKPVNDLSRGCSIEDVVLTTEVTVMQAQAAEFASNDAQTMQEDSENLPMVAPTTALVATELQEISEPVGSKVSSKKEIAAKKENTKKKAPAIKASSPSRPKQKTKTATKSAAAPKKAAASASKSSPAKNKSPKPKTKSKRK